MEAAARPAVEVAESGASGITAKRSRSSPNSATASRATTSLGTITCERALECEVAQVQVHAAPAQPFAGALERGDVVERDDHRAGAVQHRALHPRRVEEVGATGAVGLEDLILRVGGVA